MPRASRILAVLALCAPLWAGATPAKTLRYTPASRGFYCDIPAEGWHAFEEEETAGSVVHILGPDNPSGTYRTGIDVRWVEKGQPGFVPFKEAIEDLRRADKRTGRAATGIRPLRISGILARTFEVNEPRLLPQDQLPALEEAVHHYVAVIPSGESYFVIRLSSTRDVYLDYRDLFVEFLKSFKALGYK